MKKYILINSLGGGGAERQASLLAEYLDLDGIFTICNESIAYDVGNTPVIPLTKHTHQTNRAYKTLSIPWYAKKLQKKIPNNGLILSFLERSNFVNVLARKRGNQVILGQRIHPSTAFKGSQSINKHLIRLLYPKSHKIIANSKVSKIDLSTNFYISPKKIQVIYNSYSLQNIQKNSEQSLGKYEELFRFPTLIHVGRLTPQKGHDSLLRIFQKVHQKHSQSKLILIGRGELDLELYQLSQKLDLKTYSVDFSSQFHKNYDVYFLGFQKNPFAFLGKATLFVFPSLFEGFPNVLLEAMICGLPILSTDCFSGPREILAPNSNLVFQTVKAEFADFGILLPILEAGESLNRKEKIWIDVILEMLNNLELLKEYKKKSLERAKDFDINKIICQWKNIFHSY